MELPLLALLLLLLLCPTWAQSPDDAIALLAFKSKVEDPNGALGSWNSATSHCRWHGISCNSTANPRRVTSIQLDSLSLSGTISPALSNLTFLTNLQLKNNTLQGSIPPELGHLRALENLDLSVNSLKGPIPQSLGDCLDLQGLDLSRNQLQGVIPVNITNFKKLSILHLAGNNLTGVITPFLGNLTSLTELWLTQNKLGGGIPAELNKIRGLQILDLRFNKLSGNVPPALYNFSELSGLGLGGNLLEGMLPSDFGTHLPKVEYLFLYENKFEGSIPLSITNAHALNQFELSNNSFSGVVPPVFGSMPNLTALLLGLNQFVAKDSSEWRFMDTLANCTNLEQIDLSNNQFASSFPKSVVNLSNSITELIMTNNSISGEIPVGIANLKKLQRLKMDSNLLTGTIPETIGQLTELQGLYFNNNSLSGVIPESIGDIKSLTELNLSSNSFSGSIPASLGNLKRLTVLDLSYNDLSGAIPKRLFTISALSRYLNISGNSLTGPLPDEVGTLQNLQALVVSDNNLSGRIPPTLWQCLHLEYLQMGGNSLQGIIPQSLSSLKALKMLNLSHNNLSGKIPVFLTQLESLNYLNLSFNDFDGEVPTQGIFGNSSLISLLGNKKLCGGVSALHLDPCISSRSKGVDTKRLAAIIGLSIFASLAFLLLFVCMYRRCIHAGSSKKIHRKNSLSLGKEYEKFGKKSVSYKELHRATDGFSSANLVGTGSYGSVYKASLSQYRNMVAIKVLNCEQQGAFSGFVAECKILRNIRHRNLVRVLTACSTVDYNGVEFKALVYEYMSNGSLDSFLHGGERFLSLRSRIRIANDVALALDYLHYQGQRSVVHSDLKSSNVLLDDDMTAHVGDFGLARFLNRNSNGSTGNTSTVAIKGTVGYIAPEYGMGSPISIEGDLYSFGILILEMLTGKRPTYDGFQDGINIHTYVHGNYPDNILDIIDPSLLGEDDPGVSKEALMCIEAMAGIGLACSHEAPNQRMGTGDVLNQLDAIKDIWA